MSSILGIVLCTRSIYLSFLSTYLLVFQYSWHRLIYKMYLLVISKYIFTCFPVLLILSYVQDVFTCIFQVHIYFIPGTCREEFFLNLCSDYFLKKHLTFWSNMVNLNCLAIKIVNQCMILYRNQTSANEIMEKIKTQHDLQGTRK